MTTTELMLSTFLPTKNNNGLCEQSLAEEQKLRIMKELHKMADREFRENEATRKQCLAHMKEWIKQNSDIENCITDDNFLLRFLRVKKFSITLAQQVLLKYLNFRNKFKHIMYDLDYKDPKVYELISTGYIFVSPFKDFHGRRVIIYDLSKFDCRKFNGTDMSRAHAITYETLMNDEENQMVGLNHVADLSGVGAAFVTLFSITEFGYLVKWGEQSFPMKHKEIHVFNLPTALKYVYDFAKSNMSQKLKDRFTVHDSSRNLIEKVDKSCLPLEFGGEMPAERMVRMWLDELADKRERLLTFDSMNLLNDRGIIKRRNSPAHDETGIGSLPGSFRKLQLD